MAYPENLFFDLSKNISGQSNKNDDEIDLAPNRTVNFLSFLLLSATGTI